MTLPTQPPTPGAGTDLFPRSAFFKDRPEVTTARPALGLTLYLDDPEAWARGHAAALLERVIELVSVQRLKWFTSSAIAEWQPLDEDRLESLRDVLRGSLFTRAFRHLLHVRVVDDPHTPSLGFSYRELDPSRIGHAGWAQVLLPMDTASDELLALALEVGHQYPIRCGVGGYVASTNPLWPRNAFTTVYGWCRRAWGLDVQVPDLMAALVAEGLPGASWLTMMGHGWADAQKLDLGALAATRWRNPVAVMPLSRATLIRAGERPELGDQNALEYPQALREVAQRLDPFFVKELPEYPGRFGEEERTSAWFHRFAFPEKWG